MSAAKMIFCRIANMKNYDGEQAGDIPRGSGSYIEKNKTGGEVSNFKLAEDGKYYGFVEPGKNRGKSTQMHIERIDPSGADKEQISNVTVVFCAPVEQGQLVIVGWYTQATVFRNAVNKGNACYSFVTEKENATLLPVQDRIMRVPNSATDGYGFGRKQYWFADQEDDNTKSYNLAVLAYIQNYNNTTKAQDGLNKKYFERGIPQQFTVKGYGRNEKARKACLALKGKTCSICGFNGEKAYGKDFKDVIEVHHLVPISERGENYEIDPEKDLIPVCPNCHKALHTKVNGKCLFPEQLKKLFSVLLVVLMVLFVIPAENFTFSAQAAAAGKTGDCTWTLENGVLTISGQGKMGSYDGYENKVPWGEQITKVVVENGVENIGQCAFSGCSELISVELSSQITQIDALAFWGCSSLKSVNIPIGVIEIGRCAFQNCSKLENVTIPETVTKIGYNAFQYCTSLIDVVLPPNLEKIDFGTFKDCATLKSIKIPRGVTSLDPGAFSNCANLEKLEVDSDNPVYVSKNNCVIKPQEKTLVLGCKNSIIPNDGTVTKIGGSAFYGCSGIKSITIPDGVTEIGASAFRDCKALVTVNIPTAVHEIGSLAFYHSGYYNNEKNWENQVLYIDNCLISAKTSLSGNYEIKNGTRLLANSAFSDCKKMTAVTIPDGITKISDNAFCLCESLEKVNIPKTVKSIGSAAFMDCAITEIEFPESVTEIKEAAFAGCNYIQKAVLPSGVKELKYRTFANCGSLSEVILPNTLESIGKQNFSGCTSLKEIVVPENVLSIDLCNFSDDYDSNSDCSSLKHIAFLGEGTKVECCTRGDVVINDIYGHKGSFAEKFANDRRIKFVSIDDTAIPFIESATKNSVTLKPVAGYQYSLDKVNWQNSNVFKQLRLNTLYTVYQRKQESGISNLEFIPFSVTFKILEAAPALIESVAGNSVTLKPVAGYQYSVDKVNWQTSNVFTNLYSGYQYTFYQRVNFKETITYISEPSEGVTVTTTPDSPTVEDAFETKIILKKYEGYEYSLGGEIWQSSNVFDGLEPGKSYDFYQRIAETASCAASPKSDPLNVRTVKLANNTKVSVPTILKMVGNSVTLTPTDGYEYSLDGVHWQKNNVFSNLKVGSYLFYQRIAETETKRASAASKALEVYISSQKCKECSGVGIATVTIQCVDCKNGVTGYEKCSRCGGSGGYGPGTRQTCTICSGKGTMLDGFGKTITCFLCKGDGYVYTYPTCSKCGGSGRGPAIECLTCSGKGTISKTGPCENCKGSGFVNVFYLSFNANGGSNAPQKIKIEGYNSKIPNEKPVRTGYTFVGWNSLNDDVAIYQPGDCYAGVEDTLYAMWAKNCTHCNSTGRVTITERRQCSRCDGEGYVRKCNNCGSTRIIHRIYGWGSYYECDNCKSISISREKCANCSGGYYKETYERNCADCSGVGYIQESAPTILEYTDTKVVLAAKTGYEYSKDGKNYQSSNVFENLSPGTTYSFNQRLKKSGTTPFQMSSKSVSLTTDKSKLTAVPVKPKIKEKTSSSIKLEPVTGYEYSIDGKTWQSSNVFNELLCGTEYTFYQRYKETKVNYAGPSSAGAKFKTEKGLRNTPSAPVLLSKTHNRVVLQQKNGYEYSMDGITWQKSNVFSGLNPETNYLFYQRTAETEQYYASEISTSLTVRTNEKPVYIAGDLDGNEIVSDADAVYLLMHIFFPSDYPIEQPCDFNGDGVVSDADAIYLLMFTFFPNDYPIN